MLIEKISSGSIRGNPSGVIALGDLCIVGDT